MAVILSIEGNIGAGKSTLINYLKKNLHSADYVPIVYVDEPVEEWNSVRSDDDKPMLELFYADPKRYAFSFQMMAYISRLSNLSTIVKNNPHSIIVTERSLLTDYHVFAKMLHDSHDITTEEYAIYCKWFHHFNTYPVSGIIYLKCSPEKALEHCVKRNRPGENLSLEYLQKLQESHDAWLSSDTDIGVLTLQTENDVEEMMYAIEDFMVEFVDPIEHDIMGDYLQLAVNNLRNYSSIAWICYGFINLVLFLSTKSTDSQKSNLFH
jgi:deoxyadenosine/deoxycytidine kinase